MKKRLAVLLSIIIVILNVVGCSSQNDKKSLGADSKDVKLKLWVDLNQGKFYQEIIDEYIKKNPDKNYDITVIESESGKAQENVKKDPEAAADIFVLPHDQLGQLADSGIIYKNEKYGDEVKSNNVKSAYEAATYKNVVYGYPVNEESMFLYYNKAKFNEEDIKSFEKLTSKGKVGLDLAEAGADYRLAPWFVSNGTELYGANGEDVKGTTFNSPKGVNVLKWIANLGNNHNVIAVNADEIEALKSGKIDALFSGIWNDSTIKEVLGDNMGTSVYPTANFGDGDVNLKAFLGVKLYCVNSATKQPLEAMKLANYITSESVQEKAFSELGIIPTNIKAQGNENVQNDQIAITVIAMSTSEHSVVMPKIPEMSVFWPNMNALLNDAYKGKIPENEINKKLDKLVEDISKS